MEANEYVSVSIPKSLIDQIDKVVGTIGYTSRAEFIKDACRRQLPGYDDKVPVMVSPGGTFTGCTHLKMVDGRVVCGAPRGECYKPLNKHIVSAVCWDA